MFFCLFQQIVTLGMPSVSPIERVGKYVSPRDWNLLITDPNVVSYLAIDFWSYIFIYCLVSLQLFYLLYAYYLFCTH